MFLGVFYPVEARTMANDRPDELEEPDVEDLRADFTPKQQENWEEYGAPIFEELESEEARTWFLRLRRPKKRGDGMMDRDHVKTGAPEHYLRKSIEQTQRPMSSFQGMVMAGLFVDEDVQEEVDEVALEIVAAKIKSGAISQGAARRLVDQNERVAKLYGVA